jgi:hypothetical protein
MSIDNRRRQFGLSTAAAGAREQTHSDKKSENQRRSQSQPVSRTHSRSNGRDRNRRRHAELCFYLLAKGYRRPLVEPGALDRGAQSLLAFQRGSALGARHEVAFEICRSGGV